jgi:outer membrane protein insertion porin family
MRYISSSDKTVGSDRSSSSRSHEAATSAKAAVRQTKRFLVGYFLKKGNNSILAGKRRKPLRYNTIGRTVKNHALDIIPAAAALVVFVSALVAAASPAAAQTTEPETSSAQSPFINKVIITGNESISEKELKGQMKTKAPAFFNIFRKPRLDMTRLNRDIAQLEGYYHTAGFFEASVELDTLQYSTDGRFVDIVIGISEGEPTLVASVEFSQGVFIDHEELRKDLLLRPGEPYNASYLDTDLYTLQSKYFDRGYLAVSIRESVELSDYRASVYFDVSPGTQIKINNIEISGNVLSKDKVIEKEIAFDSGDICRLSKLVETQRNLYETGLFTVVDINPENLDPLDRTVDIYIRVRERKARYIEGGFGVGNILGSRIFAGWGTRNLIGTGRGLRLKVEYGYDLFEGETVDFSKMQFRNNFWRYDVEYFQRYVLGYKALMSIDGYIEKDATVENVVVRTIGGQLLTRRRLTRYSDMFLAFTDEFIKRAAFNEPINEGEVRFVSGSVSHDKRDFILNPTTGTYQFVRLKFAGGILGGDEDFWTASASTQWYWRLLRGDVIAVRVRFGYGDPYGQTEQVPIEDRFFAGGSNSVRGYQNNSLGPQEYIPEADEFLPLGGNFLMLTNIELRFDIPLLSRINISGAAFFDGGNVWENIKDVTLGDFQVFKSKEDVDINDYFYGVGLGIRYNTPIGPIRLDYGLPIKVREEQSESGLFYLSLGQTF